MHKKTEEALKIATENFVFRAKTLRGLDNYSELADNVIEKLSAIGLKADWGVLGYWSSLYINVYEVDSIKQILPVFEFISKSGLRYLWETEYPDANRTKYDFGEILVNITFGKNSDCKYIRVGTQKSPVFKFECPEGQKTNVKEHLLNLRRT